MKRLTHLAVGFALLAAVALSAEAAPRLVFFEYFTNTG